jgi:hypothetical protein
LMHSVPSGNLTTIQREIKPNNIRHHSMQRNDATDVSSRGLTACTRSVDLRVCPAVVTC